MNIVKWFGVFLLFPLADALFVFVWAVFFSKKREYNINEGLSLWFFLLIAFGLIWLAGLGVLMIRGRV